MNGAAVNVASYLVSPEDVVAVREAKRGQMRIKQALELAGQRPAVEWVQVDADAMTGTYQRHPDRSELPPEINENLIVEFYSK